MTKKHLLMMAALLLTAVSAQADDLVPYLVFQNANGTTSSITAVGTTITFSDGSLQAVNGDTTYTFPLSDLSKMYFSSTPAGINDVNAEADEGVVVYSTAGVILGQYRNLTEAQASLKRGLYLVKKAGETIKVAVK